MNIQKIPTCGLQIDLSQNKTSQGERVDKQLYRCNKLLWFAMDFDGLLFWIFWSIYGNSFGSKVVAMCQSPSTTGGSSRYPAVAVAELHHGFDGLTNGRLVVTSGMKPLRTICLYFPTQVYKNWSWKFLMFLDQVLIFSNFEDSLLYFHVLSPKSIMQVLCH